jgi:hypothetical protein
MFLANKNLSFFHLASRSDSTEPTIRLSKVPLLLLPIKYHGYRRGLRLPQCLNGAVTHGNNLELFVFLNYRTLSAGENGFTWAGSHFAGFDWFTKTRRRRSGRAEGRGDRRR